MFTWIFIFPLVILLVIFSLVNLQEIALNIWVDYQITAPVFAIFWAGLLIGLLVGLVSTWMGGRGLRQRVATLESENKAYGDRLDNARDEQTKLKARMFDATEEKEKSNDDKPKDDD